MNDDRALIDLDKMMLLEQFKNCRPISPKQPKQLRIANIARSHKQQLRRTLPKFEADLKIGIFCDQRPLLILRQMQDRRIPRPILLWEVQSVDDIVRLLPKPIRKYSRLLSIDQKSHAASGRILCKFDSRAANARQAMTSSRSRSS